MKYFAFPLFIILSFSTAAPVSAASISLVAQQSPKGEPLSIDVMVDPEGESINSAEVTLSFDPSLYVFSGYESNNGAITLWVTPPKEIQSGTVSFSGVILGGVERMYDPHRPSDFRVPLTRLLFTEKGSGEGVFSVEKATLLKNDGIGSSLSVSKKGISTIAHAGTSLDEGAVDSVPPLPFTIQITEPSVFGEAPRLATFSALDQETGIARYEVKINNGRFRETQSPLVVPERLLAYSLTVRAIDFAGNAREEQIRIDGTVPGWLLALIAVGVLIAIVWYRRRVHARIETI